MSRRTIAAWGSRTGFLPATAWPLPCCSPCRASPCLANEPCGCADYGTADTFSCAVRTEPQLSDSAASATVLALERVEKRYGAFRPALMDVNLTVARGEFVVLQGPGGSGKSVLLRLLAGLEAPSGGSVRIAGEDLAHMGPGAMAHLRRSMGILPPGDSLLNHYSVMENVALAARVAGTAADEGVRRARAALALVGVDVEHYGDAPCAQLAAGQRQCVALARALVNRPVLLLLDDLLAALDEAAAARVLDVVRHFSEDGVTIIASTRLEASGPWPAHARRLGLHDGKISQ